MKKINTKKKGFTIVELVIVIAVIGILAAILIPTFINLNNKAKVSNTTSFLKNVNTQLAMKEANHDLDNFKADYDKDGHFANRTSAENYSKEYLGYNFELISPFDGNYIDFQGGRFALVNYDDEANPEVLYAEADFDLNKVTRMPDTNVKVGELLEAGKNVYLKESIDVTELPSNVYNAETETLTIKGGLEVGNNTSVKNIKYANDGAAQEVVISTNGGTLTINAASDTVNHYGEGLVLDIQAIAGSSYHEFGYFPKASIAQGRIVVEEEGNVPAVEITAVPTAEKPVKIETNKDVVVSASQAVVTELGDNNLDNVEVKVTSAEAAVVIDEKIDSSDVTINGQAASEEQLVSIKKVSLLSELLAALTAQDKYIMFSNDIATNGSDLINITYSVTIDGNGHKLTGKGGNRGSVKQMMCFGWEAPELIEKIVVKDLSIETTTVTRALECRGNTKEIIFDGVTLKASGSGNDQGFTFGGNYADLMKLTIKNSNFSVGGDGYTFIFFNAVDMVIENSTISGWAGLYFKSPSSSHGARDSKVYVYNSDFVCHNENWGVSNAFGAIVFEDGNIDVTLVDSNLDVTSESDQEQCAILFSSGWANYFGTHLTNGHVIIKGNSSVNGSIDTALLTYDLSNDIKIEGGIFTSDPTDYLADGHTVTRNGAMYVVK